MEIRVQKLNLAFPHKGREDQQIQKQGLILFPEKRDLPGSQKHSVT